jgi:hypothetical protein
MICIAGLHHMIIYEYDSHGKFLDTDKHIKTAINNDNINKIKFSKFGIFVGLSR